MRNGIHIKRTLAAGTAALFVAGGGAGVAAACHGQQHQQSGASAASFTTFRHGGLGLRPSGAVAAAVVNYLDLPAATIKTDLASGQTLAQIATAEGKDPNGLVSAIVNAITPQLNAAVVNGKLTSAQETTLLANLTTKVTAAVNGQLMAKLTVSHGLRHGFDAHRWHW